MNGTAGASRNLAVGYLVRRDASEPAEVRLIIAVLEEAVGCYRKHFLARDPKRRRLFQDAQAWLMSEDGDQPFSFEHVCDVVGLNPAYVRRLLCEWRDQQLAASGPSGYSVELAGIREGPTAGTLGTRRERRTFTNEFKAETARLVRHRGRRIRAVARDLDLNVSVVWRWVREAELDGATEETTAVLARKSA
jgi:hypothetical protein